MAEFYKVNSKKEAAVKYPVAVLATWAAYKAIRWGVNKVFNSVPAETVELDSKRKASGN